MCDLLFAGVVTAVLCALFALLLQVERFGRHFLLPTSVTQAGQDLCTLFTPSSFLDGPDLVAVTSTISAEEGEDEGNGSGGAAAGVVAP